MIISSFNTQYLGCPKHWFYLSNKAMRDISSGAGVLPSTVSITINEYQRLHNQIFNRSFFHSSSIHVEFPRLKRSLPCSDPWDLVYIYRLWQFTMKDQPFLGRHTTDPWIFFEELRQSLAKEVMEARLFDSKKDWKKSSEKGSNRGGIPKGSQWIPNDYLSYKGIPLYCVTLRIIRPSGGFDSL